MRKIFFFLILFVSWGLSSAQQVSLFDLQTIDSMPVEKAENLIMEKWGIAKTQTINDVPAQGIENVQFQSGEINSPNFLNLEKISRYNENVLTSLFVRDSSKTYTSIKQELEQENYVLIENIQNFLAPFQTHIKTEFYIKNDRLVQLDTYEDQEKNLYHLIILSSPKNYANYREISK